MENEVIGFPMAPKSRGRGRGVARGTLGTTARAGSSRSPPEAPGWPWPGLVRIDPVTASDSVSRASRGGEPVGARRIAGRADGGPTSANGGRAWIGARGSSGGGGGDCRADTDLASGRGARSGGAGGSASEDGVLTTTG